MRFGSANYVRSVLRWMRDGDVFTTKDILRRFESRNAVDQTLHRLAAEGALKKLARGVWLKTEGPARAVAAVEVAIAKARAFGKWPDAQGGMLPRFREVITREDGRKELVLPVFGCSSSFMFGDVMIVLRGRLPRLVYEEGLREVDCRGFDPWHMRSQDMNAEQLSCLAKLEYELASVAPEGADGYRDPEDVDHYQQEARAIAERAERTSWLEWAKCQAVGP